MNMYEPEHASLFHERLLVFLESYALRVVSYLDVCIQG